MKKQLALAIIMVLMFSITPLQVDAATEKTVGGLITTDTVWRQGNIYTIVDWVRVQSGVTLTIEPGVTVNFGTYYLQVDGTLYAKGTVEKNIVFNSTGWSTGYIQFTDSSTDWNSETSSGSLIENSHFNEINLSILSSSPRIAYNTFEATRNYAATTITNSNGAAVISNNILQGLYASITVNGGSTVTDNIINGIGYTVKAIDASGNAKVTHNYINGGINGAYNAVSLSEQALFQKNTVMGAVNYAITSTSDEVKIIGNFVTNNRYGISGSGTIESNTVIDNTVGIQIFQVEESTSIHYNSIYNNTQYNFMMSSPTDLDLANNYWGTTDNVAIAGKIRDYSDDYSLGKVNYSPILTQPSLTAPKDAGNLNTDWLGFNFITPFDYNIEMLILEVAQIVAITLAIGWTIVIAVIAHKRIKSRRR